MQVRGKPKADLEAELCVCRRMGTMWKEQTRPQVVSNHGREYRLCQTGFEVVLNLDFFIPPWQGGLAVERLVRPPFRETGWTNRCKGKISIPP